MGVLIAKRANIILAGRRLAQYHSEKMHSSAALRRRDSFWCVGVVIESDYSLPGDENQSPELSEGSANIAGCANPNVLTRKPGRACAELEGNR